VKGLFDASAILPLLVLKSATPDARNAWATHGPCVTIELASAEVANGLWRKVKVGALDVQTVHDAIAVFTKRIPRISLTDAALAQALDLAMRLDHPVYDCLYAVAAQREGARLITADRRFADRLAGEPIDVLAL
jgi:predicted nucleic acid-binding protein